MPAAPCRIRRLQECDHSGRAPHGAGFLVVRLLIETSVFDYHWVYVCLYSYVFLLLPAFWKVYTWKEGNVQPIREGEVLTDSGWSMVC